MAAKKKGKVGRVRRAGRAVRRLFRRASSEPKYRILPLTFAAKAAMRPLTTPVAAQGNVAPIDGIMEALDNGDLKGLSFYVRSAFDNVDNVAFGMVEDGATAAAFAWGGRRFKLMKATRLSKNVSVF